VHVTEAQWSEVDCYVSDLLVGGDDHLAAALVASDEAGLPAISVSAPQGKFLSLLARAVGARRILEIGTLGGYSTIWLARALPADGRVVTLELDPHHAEVAESNLERAGLGALVEVRRGRATESLAALIEERVEPFDLVFIDADKSSTPHYVTASLELSHPGTVVVIDNAVRDGAVADLDNTGADVVGMRTAFELLAADPRIEATVVQTVGVKGYDGFAFGVVSA
jgi:predicted O-methyltransferase YrrM